MSGILYILAGITAMKWIFSGGEYFWVIAGLLLLGWIFD